MDLFKDSLKATTDGWHLERASPRSLRISLDKQVDCFAHGKKCGGGNIGIIIVLKECIFEVWCNDDPLVTITTCSLPVGSMIMLPANIGIVVKASMTPPDNAGDEPSSVSAESSKNEKIPLVVIGDKLCALVIEPGRINVPDADTLQGTQFKNRAGVYLCYNVDPLWARGNHRSREEAEEEEEEEEEAPEPVVGETRPRPEEEEEKEERSYARKQPRTFPPAGKSPAIQHAMVVEPGTHSIHNHLLQVQHSVEVARATSSCTYGKVTALEAKVDAMATEMSLLKEALEASNARNAQLVDDLEGIKRSLVAKMEAQVAQAEMTTQVHTRMFATLDTLSGTFTREFALFDQHQQDMSVRLSRVLELTSSAPPPESCFGVSDLESLLPSAVDFDY